MSLLSFPGRVLLPTPKAADWTFHSSVDVVASNPAITRRRNAITLPPAIDANAGH
jgi:hypothetical protein